MAKPSGNGNNDNSTSYKYKTFNIGGHLVAGTPDTNVWSSSPTGTSGNDFFYVKQDAGDPINYALSGPAINGGKGADQLILTEDATVTDTFFTAISSVEVLKLSDGAGSNVTLNSEALEAGIREVTGGHGNDTISFGSAYDTDATDVRVYAGSGDDAVCAGAGDDVLAGGSGNDSMSGEAGDDVLTGGAGADALTGGTGNDNFVFSDGDLVAATGVSSGVIAFGEGVETILDFGDGNINPAAGTDTITLNGVAYTAADFSAFGTAVINGDNFDLTAGSIGTIYVVQGDFDAVDGEFTAGTSEGNYDFLFFEYTGIETSVAITGISNLLITDNTVMPV